MKRRAQSLGVFKQSRARSKRKKLGNSIISAHCVSGSLSNPIIQTARCSKSRRFKNRLRINPNQRRRIPSIRPIDTKIPPIIGSGTAARANIQSASNVPVGETASVESFIKLDP